MVSASCRQIRQPAARLLPPAPPARSQCCEALAGSSQGLCIAVRSVSTAPWLAAPAPRSLQAAASSHSAPP
eukprot:747314-Hanusia_phi.AAC.11